MPQFQPGEAKVAIAPIVAKPSGMACEAELFQGPDEVTKVITSGRVPFVSTGAAKNVSLPITMPSSPGTYHGYIDVFAGGLRFLTYILKEDVVIVAPLKLSIPRFNYVHEDSLLFTLGSILEVPLATWQVSHLGFTLANDGIATVEGITVKFYITTPLQPLQEMKAYSGPLDSYLKPIPQPFSLAPGSKPIVYQARIWRTYGGGFWEHYLADSLNRTTVVKAEVFVGGQLVLAKEQAFEIVLPVSPLPPWFAVP